MRLLQAPTFSAVVTSTSVSMPVPMAGAANPSAQVMNVVPSETPTACSGVIVCPTSWTER